MCAARGDFAKQHFVPVALADLTELVDMVLQRGGEAGSEHITLIDNRLHVAACIVAACVECFGVRRSSARKNSAGHGAAFPVLIRKPARQKAGATVPAVPEKARTHHPARIFSDIGPAVPIDVPALLTIGSAEQRSAPVFGELRR